MNLGYAVASIIFIGIFLVAVFAQIMAKKFHPLLYWAVIVATTTAPDGPWSSGAGHSCRPGSSR